ncbi:patatin [Marmoricola sp. Leaf446]|uniref:patatin-like phospholipase family protein n=1 Tax=Marmoricola sp. Leaf446 TaxID=1736379 RepID=UPI000700E8D0|nr:patatin-like phospholipase family protein [Marmoricola sp. Leaf446]KQT94743.1 patatin [Marmoricola sp. Leaf446]
MTTPGDEDDGVALCLSGGGYRAMVFHLGVLWRLNDARLLGRLTTVSSVSGGSVTAGALAARWGDLAFDETGHASGLVEHVVEPVRRLARQDIDVASVLGGSLSPWDTAPERVVDAYRRHLFGDATLQDLPDEPRFVINATNVESGALMRFSKRYLADYRVGRVLSPRVGLAAAVAAYSAFPPFLSPAVLDLRDADWVDDEGNDLATEAYRGRISLSDGGVYDNLGLEAVKRHHTVLVSDAGGRFAPDATPASDWGRHLVRVLGVIDNQVRSLRKREVIEAYRSGERAGAYVGIRSRVADYPVSDPFECDEARTAELAAVPTRLDAMAEDRQELLVNWGYAICDAGLRSHMAIAGPRPESLPYPGRPLSP